MIKRAAILFFVVCAAALAQERAHVVVTSKEQAVVDSGEVPLKDVASVEAANPAVAARIGNYPADSLFGVAREHLEQHLKRHHPSVVRFDVSLAGNLTDMRIPAASISVVPRPISGARVLPRMCVWLDVMRDGKPYRRMPVWLNVRAYAPVVVVRQSLAPRQKLSNLAVVQEERDIAKLQGNALKTSDEAIGKRARHHIPAGTVLRESDVEPSPVVLADQEINVLVASGAVVVETKAVAEEEGHVGEYIRVRNPSSAAIFVARVVGDKSVVVTER